MSRIDDLEAQFIAAINSIAQELQTEVSNTEDAVAARFQPIADRLTALSTNPTAQVPAASGSASSSDAGASADAGSDASVSSNDAGAPPADGGTDSAASA